MPNNAYDDLFQEAGRQYNVDPQLLKTIFHIESSGNPSTKDSSAGARGGMQLMPDTASYVGVADPTDMKQAIPGAARYVAEGLEKTGSPEGALSFYFAGPDKANWGPKTAGYVQKAQSLYPQMTIKAGASAAPQADPTVDPAFSSRWGIGANAPANDVAPPSADFANRWEIAAPRTPAAPTAAAPVTQPASTTAATPPDYSTWDTAPAVHVGMPAGTYSTAPTTPSAPGNALTYSGATSALAPAPNTTYGDILPVARDNATGALRPALPTALRSLAQGFVDLAQGPTSGTVTPQATASLATLVPGLMSSPAAGTGAAIGAANGETALSRSYVDRSNVANAANIRDIAEQNQLQSAAPLSPAFKANPGVLTPQTVGVPGAAPAGQTLQQTIMQPPGSVPPGFGAAPSSPNPLVASTPVRTPNPLSTNAAAPAATASVTPTAAIAAQEAKEYAAIPEKLPPAPKIPPLNQAQADARADQLIQHFASHNGQGSAPQDLVPGYQPTLAQAQNDPGLATLERGVESANPGAFQIRKDSNQAVLKDYLAGITGSPDDVATMQASREASTAPMRDAAFANKAPTDASAVNDQINSILAGPEGKRDAVKSTLTNVQKSLLDSDGNLETDPEMLYGVRKHINDLLDPVAQRDKPELQQASRQLIGVKNSLDDAIEAGAPGFKNYVAEYAKQSQPIDEQRYLQGLNLTDQDGNINSAAVDRAIKSINKQQTMPGVQNASAVSPEKIDDLNRLQRTLQTQRISANSGKPVNSATFQNLATNSTVGAVAGNPLVTLGAAGLGSLAGGPLGAVAGAGVKMGVNKITHDAETMTKSAIIERLLNLQGKGNAVFAPKSGAGPTWRGQPIPSMTVRPNPLSSATP